jgi:hypothetical protein
MIETKRRIFTFGVASFVSATTLFVACGGTDGSALINGNPTDDGSVGSDGSDVGDSSVIVITGDGSTTSDGGGEITDGGENFGDAGSTGDGGDFSDGGTCNRIDMGTVIMSDCSIVNLPAQGGQIANGTYTLTKVSDLGSLSFCNKDFVAVPFQGGAVITSASGGASAIQLALDGDATGRKSFSWTATPASTNKSPLAIDQSCPSATSFSLPYNASNGSGLAKQSFEIEAPYGTSGGTATYHFEKN